MSQTYVLKIGGSILSTPEHEMFDFDKVNKIKDLLTPYLDKGDRFILVAGGGYICRKYDAFLKENGFETYDLHYTGTALNNVNATILRAIFSRWADKYIIAFKDYERLELEQWTCGILVGGGGEPGVSGDWDTVKLAQHFNANKIISIKDVDGVYSSDPDKDPSAKRIEKLTWDEYLNIIGNPDLHAPGDSYPVDPIAARFARDNKLVVNVVGAKDLENVKKVIEGEEFVGSIIN